MHLTDEYRKRSVASLIGRTTSRFNYFQLHVAWHNHRGKSGLRRVNVCMQVYMCSPSASLRAQDDVRRDLTFVKLTDANAPPYDECIHRRVPPLRSTRAWCNSVRISRQSREAQMMWPPRKSTAMRPAWLLNQLIAAENRSVVMHKVFSGVYIVKKVRKNNNVFARKGLFGSRRNIISLHFLFKRTQ